MKDKSISTSDWAILRVLWEKDNLSSGDIHEKLLIEKGWSKSTVKTFISRLVAKNYLHVDVSNRYPLYSCVYTEDECIKMEMHQTILRIYGDHLIKRTEYFNIYGYADEAYLASVSNYANQHYIKICEKLKVIKKKNHDIMIHRSLKNLHSAMGQKDAPDWLRVGENYGFFHLAPIKCFDNLPLEGALSFIIANVEIDQLNHGLPFYFKQGLATILSSLQMDEMIHDNYQMIMNQINDDLINDLLIEEDKIGEMRQHEVAYLFILFLIDTYTWEKILEIIYGHIKITELIKSDRHHLIDKWRNFINQNYAMEARKNA